MVRKSVCVIAIAVMVVMTGVSTVFAHGHGGRRATYAVCGVENCVSAGLHAHDRVYYQSHYDGDGHLYHSVCDVADCTVVGYHEHDGDYYCGYTLHGSRGGYAGGRGCH